MPTLGRLRNEAQYPTKGYAPHSAFLWQRNTHMYASALGGDGHGLWLVVEGLQHLRRGDLPAQSVARHLEDGVGVILVDVPHGQAPVQHLVKAYGLGWVSSSSTLF